jgi:hypothetical protein
MAGQKGGMGMPGQPPDMKKAFQTERGSFQKPNTNPLKIV